MIQTSNGSSTTLASTNGSGLTAIWTIPYGLYTSLTVVNGGTAPGFFTLDGGNNMVYVAAGSTFTLLNPGALDGVTLAIQRSGGTDMTLVQAIVN